jgi:D-psicose/D-tagatose/L-ribulose 3-epimerase
MMRLSLLQSAWVGTPLAGRAGLEASQELGFDAVDITEDPLDLGEDARAALIADVQAVDLPVSSVLVLALGLADPFGSVRRFHVDRLRRHADMAAEVGAQTVVVGLGEYIWQHEVLPPERQWDWAVDGIRALTEHCADLDLGVAMEIESCRMSLIRDPYRARAFVEQVDHPVVGVNVDCSHLWLQGVAPGDVRILDGLVRHVHLSDCNGETHGDLPPGRGNAPLLDYLRALQDGGFDGTVSVELEWSPSPGNERAWVGEAYEQSAALLRALGARG